MGLSRWTPGCPCCDTYTPVGCDCPTGKLRFIDHFTSVKSYSVPASLCSGDTSPAPTVFDIASVPGFGVIDSATSATLYQSFARPALNGLCISISATVIKPAGPGTAGLFVGNAMMFYITNLSGFTAASRRPVDASGCPSGSINVIGGLVAGKLTIKIEDAAGGLGTYNVRYCLDDSIVDQQLGLALTLNDPLIMGVRTSNGGRWKDITMLTN